MKNRFSVGARIAEIIGALVLFAVAVLYMAMTGGYIINGVGFFFLLPLSLAVYFVVTIVQFLPSTSSKTRWILYAVKLVFVVALLLLSPMISDFTARAVNG